VTPLPYGSTMIRIHLYEGVVLGRDTLGHQIKRQKEPAKQQEPRRGTGPKEFRRGRLESSDSILTYRSGIGDHGEAWRFVKRTHGSHLSKRQCTSAIMSAKPIKPRTTPPIAIFQSSRPLCSAFASPRAPFASLAAWTSWFSLRFGS
jgi:hypothetical protein